MNRALRRAAARAKTAEYKRVPLPHDQIASAARTEQIRMYLEGAANA